MLQPDYKFCAQYVGVPPSGATVSLSCFGGPVTARFLYIFLQRKVVALTLCEVEVFAISKYFGHGYT